MVLFIKKKRTYARCLRCEEPGFFLVLELDLYFGEAHEMTKTLHCQVLLIKIVLKKI